MREATMLYRSPGSHELHGVMVDYVTVDASEVPEMLAAGWSLNPLEASYVARDIEAFKRITDTMEKLPKEWPPTREEMEAKASDLGIRFDGRTSDKKLGALISAALGLS